MKFLNFTGCIVYNNIPNLFTIKMIIFQVSVFSKSTNKMNLI